MAGRLVAAGFARAPGPDQAEVIVINTCGFITPAAEESVETILSLAEYKRAGRCRRLIVTGCLPERYRDGVGAELPEVDVFLGTGAYGLVVDAARGLLDGAGVRLPDPDAIDMALHDGPRSVGTLPVAYLKVAEGCDRRCTYCVIPRLRGRQKSRPPETLLAEARSLLAAGARELVLVAQDTTDYGRDLGMPGALAGLLRDLSDLAAGDAWIRVLYGHPESLTPETLEVMADRANICSYYDLPIQHASDAVLKRMGRNHTRSELTRLFQAIRRVDPEAVLRTTVIVGFPGETRKDVDDLARFMDLIRFEHLGVFIYSDADDLPSHRLPDHVSARTAARRRNRIMEYQKTISSEWISKYLDTRLDVLIEETAEPGVSLGRTRFQAPEVDGLAYVHHDGSLKPGDFAVVTITDTLEYDLVGEARAS